MMVMVMMMVMMMMMMIVIVKVMAIAVAVDDDTRANYFLGIQDGTAMKNRFCHSVSHTVALPFQVQTEIKKLIVTHQQIPGSIFAALIERWHPTKCKSS